MRIQLIEPDRSEKYYYLRWSLYFLFIIIFSPIRIWSEFIYKLIRKSKKCRFCIHHNFRSDNGVTAWGYCKNEKANKSFRITTEIPDDIKDSEELLKFRKWIAKYAMVYFEENSFGCIHWESK